MSNLLLAATSGNYRPVGALHEATHVVAHAFGYRTGEDGERMPGPVNEDLARHLCALSWNTNWVVQEEIWAAVPTEVKIGRYALGAKTLVVHQSMPETSDTPQPAWERDNAVTRVTMPDGKYLSSQDVWEFANAQAEKWGIEKPRPLVIAHAHHVGRVAAQGRTHGAEPVVPPGLSSGLAGSGFYKNLNGLFDPESAQSWTRSRARWAIRELPAIAGLIWLPRMKKLFAQLVRL